jgi:RimJ/RimL family protein N-acetyltransferase
MCAQLLNGEHVRLVALNSDTDIQVMKRWTAHTAAWRLLDSAVDRVPAAADQVEHFFLIVPLNASHPIGHAGLFGIQPARGEAWLGFGLGEREQWGTLVGEDALRAILRYAFDALSLRCVRVGVFDYNARALRSFEDAGFVIEGRMLQEAGRDGQGRAGVCMGIRREQWENRVQLFTAH